LRYNGSIHRPPRHRSSGMQPQRISSIRPRRPRRVCDVAEAVDVQHHRGLG
jgi:hypothetical protein